MSSNNGQPPPRHAPPHIRVNSGSGDFQASQYTSTPQQRPQASRTNTSRSLTQQSRPSTAPSVRKGGPVYGTSTPADSTELLLPPRKGPRRFRDDESPVAPSPLASGLSSRRTSWSSSSERSFRDSKGGPFISPFDDSRAPSRAGSDDEGVNTQTVSEKYNILPSAGLLLFPEDVEKDDYLHTPDPNDKDRMKCTDLFSKRGLVNVGGLALITLGVLTLFIGYPILTFVQGIVNPPGSDACATNPNCINDHAPLLQNVRTGLIDPDTPSNVQQRTGANGQTQVLVFSDEFNDPGRTFYDGDDAYWAGIDAWYGATLDIEWYDPDAITTQDGYLAIRFDAFQNHDLNYRSGMLQSWNKMCFKSGYLEASISLPGAGDTSGFWPGFWTMGNLGRPGYLATSDGMWPYSYDNICDAGITPNQSDPDGLNYLPGMRLPACTCSGAQHPSPGISRSAPEIDALEATVGYLLPPAGDAIGEVSQSLQIAPFDIFWQPNAQWQEIYDYSITSINPYQGGQYQEAVSGLTILNNDWYNGKAYQIYGFDYVPGAQGQVVWNVGNAQTWKVTGQSFGPNGNIGQRVIPEEPMHVIINFGMSPTFAPINFTGLADLLPATMRIDYVRIYQDSDGEMTCDPEGYPTTSYIANHAEAYNNPNKTTWAECGYPRPQNSLMDGCAASNYNGPTYSSGVNSKREESPENEKRTLKNARRHGKRSWFT